VIRIVGQKQKLVAALHQPGNKLSRTGQQPGAGVDDPVHVHDKRFLISPVVSVHGFARLPKILKRTAGMLMRNDRIGSGTWCAGPDRKFIYNMNEKFDQIIPARA
jgi:hypothetical protein